MSGPPPPHGPPGVPLARPTSFTQNTQTAEELAEEKRRNREALRSLAAKPELLAVATVFLLTFGIAIDFDTIGLILGAILFVVFGWIYLFSGDSIVASVLLLILAITSVAVLTERVEVDDGSLWWVLPMLLIILADTATSYSGFRRRGSEISTRIGQTLLLNVAAIVAATMVIAVIVRWLTRVEGRVEWPWFASTVIVLVTGWFAALVVLRRTATPAERRRYLPGRRMLPPPR